MKCEIAIMYSSKSVNITSELLFIILYSYNINNISIIILTEI
jgi:hypothetical protein